MPNASLVLRSADVAALLERSRDGLIEEWTRRVRTGHAVTGPARDLPQPYLVDHMPRLVADLVAALEARAVTQAPAGDIGRTVWHGAHAEAHAAERFREGYALDEVLRELSVFRATVVELLHRQDRTPELDAFELVHTAIDEAMAVAARSYEEEARSTLAQSEAAYRRIVTSVADHAIILLDVDGHVRTWNVGAERITGYRADEILGQRFDVLYPPEQRPERPRRMLDTATRDGLAKDAGWRMRKGGTRFFAEVTLTAIHDAKGVLCGFSKVTRDVTERWRSEQELRKSRELLKGLIDHSPALVAVKDLEGRYLLTNRRFAELLAPSGASIVGRDDREIVGGELGDRLYAHDVEVRQLDHAIDREEVAPDGSTFLVSRFPVRDAEQRTFATAAIATDITERKRTERVIAAREQRFRDLFALAPIGIAELDPATGEITRSNPRLCAITGYGEDELRGRVLDDLADASVRSACGAAFHAVLHGPRTSTEHETRFVRKDGTTVCVRAVLAAFHAEGEERAIAIALVEDIESRKALEREREQAAEQRERFVGIVSHDLRNPLGAILSAVYLLERKGAVGGTDTALLARIHRSADSMRALIHDLLDYERARAGVAVPITTQPVELCALIDEVVAETRQAHPRSPIEVEQCAALRGQWDPARVQQALTNLLVNAIHHGEPERPVRVAAVRRDGHAELSVWNAGAPIPGGIRDTLFEPFKRAQRGGAGVGLGLFIVREIAIAHGGTVEFESSTEQGTTFRLVLPLA
ncbi:PAS domain S-box protein [Sandaracinus amylolyticus]|uniref:histidine kinase n=1 Tax=Sandaracinus amylolyticus TaxID=927083 RepID=A0A0F6YMA6_9BACT|nr:PAS domain S-box protein [Sandaracinus amylolyticus]AKF10788.1 Two-component hybrid sensor and regulator [Sandaracinus amylolyticus]